MTTDGERDADGRIDVATAHVHQTPHYRRDNEPRGERDLNDTGMFSVPLSAQGTDHKHEDHRPDEFAQQVAIESSLREFVKAEELGNASG